VSAIDSSSRSGLLSPGVNCGAGPLSIKLRRAGFTMMRKQGVPEQTPLRRGFSIREGLLIAFALVVLLVSGSLLTASLLGTARLGA